MQTNQAEIISIGNEVLAGYTVNTNATFISQQLLAIGLPVNWVTTISDEHDEILKALTLASTRARAVLITGGLGPTPDDLTKQAICDFFKVGMRFDEDAFANVKQFLKARNIPETDLNRAQAEIPDCDRIIPNTVGTAPGLAFERNGVHYFFMPGVPGEMKRMVADHIAPFLKNALKLTKVHTRLLRTTGIPESRLYEKLAPILESYPEVQIAFLPRYIGVDMRFRLISDDQAAISRYEKLISRVQTEAQSYIFTESNEELEQVLNRLLTEGGYTLTVAESFTGGLLSNLLTDIPGSSAYFMKGLITYSNQSKIDLLSVSPKTLEEKGAVSADTALEMVRGAQTHSHCDCAIATTGIAGPGGGSEEKPVGLCYVAARFKEKEMVKEFHFGNDRLVNKKRGAVAGMEMLRRLLLE